MATPILTTDTELHRRLEDRIEQAIEDSEHWENAYAEAVVRLIVRRAAEFFSRCPDDFCMQSKDWADGHVIFGGTNRLHWTIEGGFWPSREHCSPSFLEQFKGEVWEPLGYTNEDTDDPHVAILGSHPESHTVIVNTVFRNSHHSILGRKGKDGRVAEVRIITGTEA